MNRFGAALWGEALKARRTALLGFSVLAICLLPGVGGLFMIILKDPAAAKGLGLISTKAQLMAGVADWPTYLGILSQGLAVAGSLIFGLITAWVFGREFAERTAKELLAVPTPRSVIVAAKLIVTLTWALALTLIVIVLGFGVGWAVDIPGGSTELAWSAVANLLLVRGESAPGRRVDRAADAVGRVPCRHRAWLPGADRLDVPCAGAGADHGGVGLGRSLPLVGAGVDQRRRRAERGPPWMA